MSRFNSRSKAPTKAEKEHIAAVKNLPCIICHPELFADNVILTGVKAVSDADHVTECGRRLGHSWVIPLCCSHHTGSRGYSGLHKDWDTSFANQMELCRKVYKKLGKIMPEPTSKIIKRVN